MASPVSTVVQLVSILLISLVAGSVFGVWRGYNPSEFSPTTFLEVHQGAVRGLNVLLPAMALATLLLVAFLAFSARGRWPVFWLYVLALVGIAAGGIVTRLFNQSINAEVMTWTVETMPANWAAMRDSWWNWHIVRTAISIGTEIILLAAVFADREG